MTNGSDSFDDLFDPIRREIDKTINTFRPVLESAWKEARRQILNAAMINADSTTWMFDNPDQMGDAAVKVDKHLHQKIAGWLHVRVPEILVYGEESPPVTMILDPNTFNRIAYVDALDGSRQAFSLPGGWSINLVVQRYLGPGEDLPNCQVSFLGMVDAEGVTVTWTHPSPYGAEIKIIRVDSEDQADGNTDDGERLLADQFVVGEGEDFGITGDPIVVCGGYKPGWWDKFRTLREAVRDVPVFNTGGAPVARKVLQNSDVVAVQLSDATLWDGVAVGLIAAAGGYVCELGSDKPVPPSRVFEWFSNFGYKRRGSESAQLTENYCIPAYVAGMDGEHVLRIARELM